jgi:hypothetical protein
MLRKGRGEQRVVKIYDSPCLPEAEAVSSTAPFSSASFRFLFASASSDC